MISFSNNIFKLKDVNVDKSKSPYINSKKRNKSIQSSKDDSKLANQNPHILSTYNEVSGVIKSVEDPININLNQIYDFNTYAKPFKYKVRTKFTDLLDAEKNFNSYYLEQVGALSLFNPINAVAVEGMTKNIPLYNTNELNDNISFTNYSGTNNDYKIDKNRILGSGVDVSDCSIKKLVELSNVKPTLGSGELGRARYKYADFMYCADLGNIPNNLLITLRRFPYPVGDNIFKLAAVKDENNLWLQTFDVARLVTWFGTEDNKLSEILNYNYHATWLLKDSKIEDMQSQGKDDTSILSKLANTLSEDYLTKQSTGEVPTNDLFQDLAASIGCETIASASSANVEGIEYLKYHDQNKVFTPLNTVQSTNMYEGKLEFKHSIKLVFKYKLRAYDNINPKAAFLDLLANILVCTYRRGKFWGGDRRLIGPIQNLSVYEIADKFFNNTADKLGGFIGNIVSGGKFSDSSMSFFGGVMDAIGGFGNDLNNIKDQFIAKMGEKSENSGKSKIDVVTKIFTNGLTSQVLNIFGRPKIYAVDSLLSGREVGFWHLTIGNPRNPIASIGNLILQDAKITHSGPLGIDDFPTELTVEILLEHGRPRDLADIERMYTRGESSIYLGLGESITRHRIISNDELFTEPEPQKNDPDYSLPTSFYNAFSEQGSGAFKDDGKYGELTRILEMGSDPRFGEFITSGYVERVFTDEEIKQIRKGIANGELFDKDIAKARANNSSITAVVNKYGIRDVKNTGLNLGTSERKNLYLLTLKGKKVIQEYYDKLYEQDLDDYNRRKEEFERAKNAEEKSYNSSLQLDNYFSLSERANVFGEYNKSMIVKVMSEMI